MAETERVTAVRLRATFGAKVENSHASPDNPTRIGFFVREGKRTGRLNKGPYVVLTDGRGKFWESRVGDHLSVIEGSPLVPLPQRIQSQNGGGEQ